MQLLLYRNHARHRWENQRAEGVRLDRLDLEEILRTGRELSSTGGCRQAQAWTNPSSYVAYADFDDRIGIHSIGGFPTGAVSPGFLGVEGRLRICWVLEGVPARSVIAPSPNQSPCPARHEALLRRRLALRSPQVARALSARGSCIRSREPQSNQSRRQCWHSICIVRGVHGVHGRVHARGLGRPHGDRQLGQRLQSRVELGHVSPDLGARGPRPWTPNESRAYMATHFQPPGVNQRVAAIANGQLVGQHRAPAVGPRHHVVSVQVALAPAAGVLAPQTVAVYDRPRWERLMARWSREPVGSSASQCWRPEKQEEPASNVIP